MEIELQALFDAFMKWVIIPMAASLRHRGRAQSLPAHHGGNLPLFNGVHP